MPKIKSKASGRGSDFVKMNIQFYSRNSKCGKLNAQISLCWLRRFLNLGLDEPQQRAQLDPLANGQHDIAQISRVMRCAVGWFVSMLLPIGHTAVGERDALIKVNADGQLGIQLTYVIKFN